MDQNIEKKIETMLQDPRTGEWMKDKARPESQEEAVGVYAEIAEKLGLSLTAEDIMDYIRQAEQTCKDRTEKAAARIQELSDEEVEQVSGGRDNSACVETYMDCENCRLMDGCDMVFQQYADYACKHNFNPGM